MEFLADLHIHSRFSRAVSQKMTLPELDRWADDKGISVMGTGDFTHPIWSAEIKKQLIPAEPGLFKLKPEHKLKTIKGTLADTRFLLTVEISSIYSRGGKTRRVHTLIFSPDVETVEKINAALGKRGKLASDGRPILGLDVQELAKIVFTINPEAVIVPAHIWTPWFSLFGSMSGFNSLEECFGEFARYIFAMETGLSSDPLMNWYWSKLDNIALISNSDSHSLERIGREANIFNTERSYSGIMGALRKNNPTQFVATIEYFPEEGKYHFDGHRKCGISFAPEQTRKHRGICPQCGKPLVVGVMNRVKKLADRESITPQEIPFERVMAKMRKGRVPFINLVTLDTIIAESLGKGVKTKTVKKVFDELIKAGTNEYAVLVKVPTEELSASAPSVVVEGIERMRKGQLVIEPGYDGEYGKVKIFKNPPKIQSGAQSLF